MTNTELIKRAIIDDEQKYGDSWFPDFQSMLAPSTIICKNCQQEINDAVVVECVECKSTVHTTCASLCVKCGNIMCDECFMKNKFKCDYCNPKPSYAMEFISSTMFEAALKCMHLFYDQYIFEERYKNRDAVETSGNKYSESGKIQHDLFDTYSKYARIDFTDTLLTIILLEFEGEFSNIQKDFFEDDDDYEDFLERGRVSICNWFKQEKTKPIPLHTEMLKYIKINDELPLVRITVDRINGVADKPATWEIEDYKTGKVYSSDMLKKNMQLPIYALAIKREYGEYPKTLRFLFPQHEQERSFYHKGDGIYECKVPRGGTYIFDVSKTEQQMIQIYKNIVDGKFTFNTDNQFFCDNFCHLGTTKACDGLSTRWKNGKKKGK